MTTAILESLFLAVLALISWTAGFISGRGRAVIHSAAYKRGKADGYRTGRTEHEAERDRLEETITELRRMLAGQMRAAAECRTCNVRMSDEYYDDRDEHNGPFSEQDARDWQQDHQCEPDVVIITPEQIEKEAQRLAKAVAS